MRKQLYVVYDVISLETIGPVFMEGHDAPAIRAFSDAILSDKTDLSKHPHDYELRYLGDIDTGTGQIMEPEEKPETIITGSAIINNKEKDNA